jgi:hypothetical protein
MRMSRIIVAGALLGTAPLAAIGSSAGRPISEPSVIVHFDSDGTPDIQSAGPIAFSPQGVLFAGDSRGAAVFALEPEPSAHPAQPDAVTVDRLDERVAAVLGTTAANVRIVDMAVHPVSRTVYLSVSRGQGAEARPVLVRLAKGGLEPVDLTRVKFSKAALEKPPVPGVTVKGWQQEARTYTVTDMAFVDGRLYVAGLSNEEFASTMRVVPFPFGGAARAAGLEVYHVSHGQYETHAPINVFTPYRVNGKPALLATYSCLPLASFPLESLTDGARVRGTTVAELGSGQAATDMLSYEYGGKPYLLVAAGGGLYRFDATQFAHAGSLTAPLNGGAYTAGASYTTLEKPGAKLLGELDATRLIVARREGADGPWSIRTVNKGAL